MSAKTSQTRMIEGPIARQSTAFALPLSAARAGAGSEENASDRTKAQDG